MGLIISSTEEKQINIKDLSGQVVPTESVYSRIESAARIDGKTVECAFGYTTISKEAFKLGAPFIATDIPSNCSGEVLVQDHASIHELVKTHLESLGYSVVIDL
jgi:hypothetical protein